MAAPLKQNTERTTYRTRSADETEHIAAALAETAQAGDVFALFGGMGAGKTCFTRGFCRGLGCADPVSSPTFALENVYTGGRLTVYHFDFYRISGTEDLESCGFFDALRLNGVIVTEWSEKLGDDLPPDAVRVTISADGVYRRITVERRSGK